MNERLNSRMLREFNEIELGNYHAPPEEILHHKSGTMIVRG
jgi:hypothetical protein